MARINIEDRLWKDPAFQDLMIKVGNRQLAKGMVIELFALAQEFWFPDRKPIPLDRLRAGGLTETVTSGLAEERDGGVYVRGSEKAFAWLFQKKEAGRKGGQASAKRKSAGAKRKSAEVSGTERNQPSFSSSSSSFSSSSSDSSSFFSKEPEKEKTAPPNAGAFIATYCRVWKERYQARPEITGKEQGIAKRLTGDIGSERASALVESFLRMNDSWFLQKRHDLATFEQNLNAVVQFHETGARVTRTQIQQTDRQSHAEDQLKRIAEGSL